MDLASTPPRKSGATQGHAVFTPLGRNEQGMRLPSWPGSFTTNRAAQLPNVPRTTFIRTTTIRLSGLKLVESTSMSASVQGTRGAVQLDEAMSLRLSKMVPGTLIQAGLYV